MKTVAWKPKKEIPGETKPTNLGLGFLASRTIRKKIKTPLFKTLNLRYVVMSTQKKKKKKNFSLLHKKWEKWTTKKKSQT